MNANNASRLRDGGMNRDIYTERDRDRDRDRDREINPLRQIF